MNPYVCFVAGTQVVVAVENEGGGDALPALTAKSAETAVAAAMRVRYITVAIEDLVARGGGENGDGGGQWVIARDQYEPDGPLVKARIVRTYRRTAYHLQVLIVRDAEGREQTIRVTDEHPVAVEGRDFVPARLLQPGDPLPEFVEHNSVVIANVGEDHPEGVIVYNLEVEGVHTYFVRAEGSDAEPLWVHNNCVFDDAVGRWRDRTTGQLVSEAEARIANSTLTLPDYEIAGPWAIFRPRGGIPELITTRARGQAKTYTPENLRQEIAASHMEGVVADMMNARGYRFAELEINHPEGVCPYCNSETAGFLEVGRTLQVEALPEAVPMRQGWVVNPRPYRGTLTR